MADESFRGFVPDQLNALPNLRTKAMFGGYGLYQGERFFGILFEGGLYFKTDTKTQPVYVASGMLPFNYEQRGRKVTMRYYGVPPDVLEDRIELAAWADRAIEATKAKEH